VGHGAGEGREGCSRRDEDKQRVPSLVVLSRLHSPWCRRWCAVFFLELCHARSTFKRACHTLCPCRNCARMCTTSRWTWPTTCRRLKQATKVNNRCVCMPPACW
jgi:hypothetical protein